jgi:hypothetical protein
MARRAMITGSPKRRSIAWLLVRDRTRPSGRCTTASPWIAASPRTMSPTPSVSSARSPFAATARPAPIGRSSGARSTTVTDQPCR